MKKILFLAFISLFNQFYPLEGIESSSELQPQISALSTEISNSREISCHNRCRRKEGPEGPRGPQGPAGSVIEAFGGLQLTQIACTDPITFTGTGGPILDLTTSQFSILNVPPLTLTSISVTLTNLTHTFASNIGAFVTLPNATVIPLFFRFGGSNDYNGTYTFTDDGSSLAGVSTLNPIPSGSYFATSFNTNHTYVNMNSIVSGLNSAGTWTLSIQDLASLDTGNLGSWTITLNCPSNQFSISSSYSLAPLNSTINAFNNIMPIGSTLKILYSGDYQISYAFTTNAPGAAELTSVEAIVGVNGDTTTNDTLGTFFIIKNELSGSKQNIIHLNSGDTIGLYFRTSNPTPLVFINPYIYFNAVLLQAD